MLKGKTILDNTLFDLCIVGGGIQGAGVARDAALRGIKVILCEQGDFAAATSSNSSKLIHGGLRYLERLEFSLVYESLRERSILLKTAPQLVKPLSLVIPFYDAKKVAGRRPGWIYKLGLILYDLLAGDTRLPKHRTLDLAQVQEQCPVLQLDGLKSAAQYYDCQMQDARLALMNILDAARHGATCLNYTKVDSINGPINSGALYHIKVRDQLTSKVRKFQAKAVVNAAGPWVEEMLRKTNHPPRNQLVQQAKGAHLLFQSDIKLQSALLLEVPHESRIFFVLPWGEDGEQILVGTTDTPFHQPLSEIHTEKADVDYLMNNLRGYIDKDTLKSWQLIGTFAGVRPLSYQQGENSCDLSRDYRIVENAVNFWTILGGKYTVYRKIAAQIVDRYCQNQQLSQNCRTASLSLPGSQCDDWGDDWQKFSADMMLRLHEEQELSLSQAKHLVYLYGTECQLLIDLMKAKPHLKRPLTPELPYLAVEVVHAFEHEFCKTIEDWVIRRTQLFYSPVWPANHQQLLKTIAQLLEKEMGFSTEELKEQRESLQQRRQEFENLCRQI